MKQRIKLYVNGKLYAAEVGPWDTLLHVLRDDLGLRGTKYGCGSGDCGACTVLVDGRPFNSCLLLAVRVRERQIETVEGLARGDVLHPLQQAFIEHGACQCGYCTPGILMSAKALLDANASPSEHEIRTALAGNLCRCTGYKKIIEAIQAVGASVESNGQ